ncbi:MAG: acetyl-CoA C-acetyltransferase [Bdellovibrionales bacterium]|nr:acetyl-CoA C-acetyltransferase [Bdellovibrionales bacterium]
MKSENRPVYLLGSARVPFMKSQTSYANVSRADLMLGSLQALVKNYGLKGQLIGDTALGALMNSSGDWNLARECLLSTEVHPDSPAYNVQRACGTSLETTWHIAMKIHTGAIDLGISGGVDTNSDIPIEVSDQLQRVLLDLNRAKTFGQKMQAISQLSLKALKPKTPAVNEPRTRLSMGAHCELMVKEWKISRAEQDEIALSSHLNGSKAFDAGFFNDLIVPFQGFNKDGTLRGDTSLEKLAKLKPAFDPVAGTLTAGNSSPLTDGSACVLLGSESGANKLGLKPLAQMIDVQAAAVDFVHGAGLLMAPTKAVSKLLSRNGLSFQDFDYFEIHEAFAGQVLCNMKAWESDAYCRDVLGRSSAIGSIDRKKLNVVGSSIAMGHPFAATGARITGTLAKLLSQGGKKRGLISICTAGGMGVAAILESV